MRLSDVMDDLAVRLRSIPAFREVAAYPKGSVTPPAAIVSYPEEYNPNLSYNRGAARVTMPVWVVVGKASERTARDLLSQFVDGEGAASVIAVLQADGYTAFDSLLVSNVEFAPFTISDIDYIAAVFDCDIIGSGR